MATKLLITPLSLQQREKTATLHPPAVTNGGDKSDSIGGQRRLRRFPLQSPIQGYTSKPRSLLQKRQIVVAEKAPLHVQCHTQSPISNQGKRPARTTPSLQSQYEHNAAAPVHSWRPWPNSKSNSTAAAALYGDSKKYEGSSEFVKLKYHMGPVLTANITVYPIWYGAWRAPQKRIIRDFIASISAPSTKAPSVAAWWRTVTLYTDQTGANISSSVRIGAEKSDRRCSHGKSLTRLSVQSVIKSAVSAATRPLPINPRSGVYLLLTSDDVYVQDFCNNVCGFHYFTFPSIVGYTLPYAWVGNSAKLCPGECAYPFAVPGYIPGLKAVKSPNGDVGVDGMISVIAHEIAEVATNPLVNAWYAGGDPVFPVEIADLCEGIYGTGGGGSYTGQMMNDREGATYNMNGIRRRFLVQWVWNNLVNYCTGPNALDH